MWIVLNWIKMLLISPPDNQIWNLNVFTRYTLFTGFHCFTVHGGFQRLLFRNLTVLFKYTQLSTTSKTLVLLVLHFCKRPLSWGLNTVPGLTCQSTKRLVSARGFKITKPCEWVTAFRRCEKSKEIEPNRLLGSARSRSHFPGYIISHWQVAGGHNLPKKCSERSLFFCSENFRL